MSAGTDANFKVDDAAGNDHSRVRVRVTVTVRVTVRVRFTGRVRRRGSMTLLEMMISR